MSNSYVAFGESLGRDAQETTSRVGSKGKALALVSFFVGLGFAVLLVSQPAVQNSINLMGVSTGLRRPATSYSIASLPGPSALKNLVAQGIQAKGGQCTRDVSMNALKAEDYKLMFSSSTKVLSEEEVSEMAGVTAPAGLWDPLGIATSVPEGQLLFFREAELKHGRVCMLAVLGLIVAETHRFIPILNSGIDPKLPGYLLGTPFIQETPFGQFWPIAVGGLFFEEARHEALRKEKGSAPGDYGWDPLNLKPKDAKGLKELQNKELNNGRLAMFAAAGIIAQEMVENKDILPLPR